MRRTFPSRPGLGLIPGLALATTLLAAAPTAAAATLKVCPSGCPYTQIGPALADASSGDTIRVGAGTYTGGITITRSIRLLGAGAGRTTIKGGGPVVTIGHYGATKLPTVHIDGVTVTGGVTHSSPLSLEWVEKDDVIALGGGIEIAPNADLSAGPTVTISHSVITGNRAAPTATVPTGLPCPGGPCSFAWARGGGIDSWGDLTLVDTTISNNAASGVASDANGGGVNVWDSGSLTLEHSRVIGNRAVASIPDGRFAEGGGIFSDQGIKLTVRDSVVDDNTASLSSVLPYEVPGADPLEMNANGGGIHAGDGGTVIVDGSVFRGNRATVTDPNGQPYALDAAIHAGDGRFILRHSTIADNVVIADVLTTADIGPSGSAMDIFGLTTITHTSITGNMTIVTSQDGVAGATGAALYALGTVSQPMSISDSVIRGNTTIASSTHGSAYVFGGAIVNDGRLVLSNDVITDNAGIVRAPTGSAHGGAIWNGVLFGQAPFELTLKGTSVSGNRLRGTSGITMQGGGLYTMFPVTLRQSHITGNVPDDCFGCVGAGPNAPHRPAFSRPGRLHAGDAHGLDWRRLTGR